MHHTEDERRRPHVVVVGAGFGGLTFCQRFACPEARITLVDRQNHHLFQPLLYQVATAGLSAPEIAQPIRSILRNKPNVTVLMREVTGPCGPHPRQTRSESAGTFRGLRHR